LVAVCWEAQYVVWRRDASAGQARPVRDYKWLNLIIKKRIMHKLDIMRTSSADNRGCWSGSSNFCKITTKKRRHWKCNGTIRGLVLRCNNVH
jgi:hypothetical protein